MQKRPGEPDLLLSASTAGASTSVVKGQKRDLSLRGLEVLGGALAVACVLHDVEADLLAFDQGLHSGAFDGRDVDENVRLAVAQLDKAKTFGRIEELDGSRIHGDFLSNRHSFSTPDRLPNAVFFEIEKEDRQSATAQKQSSPAKST
jgi:hypothetical protein